MKPIPAFLCLLLAGMPACSTVPASRPAPMRAELWIDLVRGEEVADQEVLADLVGAGAIYLGEAHSNRRHHDLQLRLMQELFARRVELVLCLEQLEASDQTVVDRYNRREIDFDALVRDIDWAKKWSNYSDYRALCEFARLHRIPIYALNAPAAVIRDVNRGGGVAKLPAAQRAQLPPEIVLDDPAYERLITQGLAGHTAVDAAKLRPMFEAQVARDEAMAAGIVAARRGADGNVRTAMVILGAGHVRYGLGTPARVRRREPEIVDRIVIITEGGPLRLTEGEKSASHEINLPHSDLRTLARPPADYLRVLPSALPAVLPPGHPPIRP